MDENLGLALLRDLQQQSSQFHSTDEFMQYKYVPSEVVRIMLAFLPSCCMM